MTYIVTGFFTPDAKYARLAETFAANLDRLSIPHQLYAVSFDGGWDRQLMAKPDVVLRCMAAHPGKTVVLMDIDCIVRGDIAPALGAEGDVLLHMRTKLNGRRATTWPSSRVVAFKSTPGARVLAAKWLAVCKRAAEDASPGDTLDDERLLMAAISSTPGVLLSILPDAYAAHEIDEIGSDAVIVHQSAHDEVRKAWRLQRALKEIRRGAVSRLIGRPYIDWKYGIENRATEEPHS